MNKITRTKAKKLAWTAFSKYIRQKYADENGYVTCYTCDKILPWRQMQAGHGIGGRSGAVLFMEEVVKPQCVGCNVWGRGKYARFTQKLIEEYGPEKYAELVYKTNQVVKYTVQDYLDIAVKYS